MKFELPSLPYSMDSLHPQISRRTLEFHYGKHHKGYVEKTNTLKSGTEFDVLPLEEIIRKAEGPLFNNAAQIWNHTFYWNCLSPNGGGEPRGKISDEIFKSFGSYRQFRDKFSDAAAGLFGSGWVWLVRRPDGRLDIEQRAGAGNPMRDGERPLLTCDVWEHAYYLDYQNDRAAYVQAFWDRVHWAFAEQQLLAP